MEEEWQKACCLSCGTVQAQMDETWREACHQIYETYEVYHQGGGAEQPVFDAKSSAGTPRSLKLLQKLMTEIRLPEQGRALDIGCGNGNFIRSFSSLLPGWKLNGAEYNTIYRDQVLAIPNVEGFYSCDIQEIPGPFDFISLIHVLEHIENPISFLQKIAALSPAATLLIEVPFFQDNPYELLIADHATHYTPQTLSAVLRLAGYSVLSIHTDWILKEISAVAVTKAPSEPSIDVHPQEELASAISAVNFLADVKRKAQEICSQSRSFGLFGTSIGGTWLCSELEGNVDFFVDEDSSRVGKKHLNIDIVAPSQIPEGSAVFMPLATRVARDVAYRLQRAGIDYHYI